MEFRPCIDIHDGKVKQIVGGSLTEADRASIVKENFVAEMDAAFYAKLYKSRGIRGGHVILLNGVGTEGYEKTKEQALLALSAYPGGLQAGGGITAENAGEYGGAAGTAGCARIYGDGRRRRGHGGRGRQAYGEKHCAETGGRGSRGRGDAVRPDYGGGERGDPAGG